MKKNFWKFPKRLQELENFCMEIKYTFGVRKEQKEN